MAGPRGHTPDLDSAVAFRQDGGPNRNCKKAGLGSENTQSAL